MPDITQSPFYISFFKNFDISGKKLFEKQEAYFFSVLIKTNETGRIVFLEENKGMDSIFNTTIKKVFARVDRNGLKSYSFKNTALLVPVFILGFTESNKYNPEEFLNLWKFQSRLPETEVQVLPPLVIYHKTGADAVKN